VARGADPTRMTSRATSSPWKRTAILFLGHLVNDGYGELLTPLLPLLIKRLDLSLAMAGLLGTFRIVINSLAQPIFGLLVDRMERPVFAVVGPAVTVIAMSLVGLALSYPALALLMLASGLGSALFHPAAATYVGRGADRNRGLLMAFFGSGGTFGASLAPILVVPFVMTFGFERTAWLVIPGLAAVLLIGIRLLRAPRGPREAPPSPAQADGDCTVRLPRRFAILWIAIVLRSLAGTTFSYFMAVLITSLGGSPFVAAAGLTTFWFAGAAGEYAAGHLSDRHGRKPILFWAMLLATPFLLAFLYAPRSLHLPFLALAGVFLYASNPVGIVAAQECLPGRTGLVTGLVMGFAWGIGGLALGPLGRLADLYGLVPVMTWIGFLPLLSAILVLFYRENAVGKGRSRQ